MKRMKWVTLFILAGVMLLSACAKSSYETAVYDMKSEATYAESNSSAMPQEAEVMYDEVETEEAYAASGSAGFTDIDKGAANQEGADLSNRKIIQNKYIYMETLKFEDTVLSVERLVNKYFGYIESSQITGVEINSKARYNNRWGNYRIRIPADSFEAFVAELVLTGNVLDNSNRMQDVTTQYLDLEARIHSLKVQEERLLELVAKGDDLEAILQIETKLADVRYQIETYSATLGNLDNQVKYGTVELDIREVYEETIIEPTPVTTGEKIANGFKRSLENIKDGFIAFIIWFISAIPYLVIWGLIITVIVVLIVRIAKSREKKRIEKFEKKKAIDLVEGRAKEEEALKDKEAEK